MILAIAFFLQCISVIEICGLVLVEEDLLLINRALLEDKASAAGGESLNALVQVADSIVRESLTVPASNADDRKPKNSFVSFALDSFPPAEGADSTSAMWEQQAGAINPELLASSPDHLALQFTLWDSWTLGVAYRLTGQGIYRDKGITLLNTTFMGSQALLPNMEYARVLPVTSTEDARFNNLGFQEMNDVSLALDAAELLELRAPSMASFNNWIRRYSEWLTNRLEARLSSLGVVDRLWYHIQRAFMDKHLGRQAMHDAHCVDLEALFPQLIDEDGSLMSMIPTPNPEASRLETMHGLVMAAMSCSGSAAPLWALESPSATVSGSYMRRATNNLVTSLDERRIELLPFIAGGIVGRHASQSLALLYAQNSREGVSDVMLRVLASNPELQRSRLPVITSLAHVSGKQADKDGTPLWAGYRLDTFSCSELEDMQMPCTTEEEGFKWSSRGGFAIILLLILVPLILAAVIFFLLHRRRRMRDTRAHEMKAHGADKSVGEPEEQEDKIEVAKLEVGKVKVDPYEPDGYDPNNTSKILGDLTTGEQVLKARELRQKMFPQDPRSEAETTVGTPTSGDIQEPLAAVMSNMSGGNSGMSMRERSYLQTHSSFMAGGGPSHLSSHSTMGGTPSMMGTSYSQQQSILSTGSIFGSAAQRSASALWKAERKSSEPMASRSGQASSSRHGSHHSGKVPQQQRGAHAPGPSSRSSRSYRPSSSGHRQGGSSAPLTQAKDQLRPSRHRHRTVALGAVAPVSQQQPHRSSKARKKRGVKKADDTGRALIELDQALTELQRAVKPTRRKPRKPKPGDSSQSALPSATGGTSRSRRTPKAPSLEEAHAKVLSAIDSRLSAASEFLAGAGKGSKPRGAAGAAGGSGTLQVTDEPIEEGGGPVRSDGEESSGGEELSFTLPAKEDADAVKSKQTLRLMGFQWLYTADDAQSAEALRENIAEVQRQLKENPGIVAAAAAAAADLDESGALPNVDESQSLMSAADEHGVQGAMRSTVQSAGSEVRPRAGPSTSGGMEQDGEAGQSNAYAVVKALVATARREAAAMLQMDVSGSSDEGEEDEEDEEEVGPEESAGIESAVGADDESQARGAERHNAQGPPQDADTVASKTVVRTRSGGGSGNSAGSVQRAADARVGDAAKVEGLRLMETLSVEDCIPAPASDV